MPAVLLVLPLAMVTLSIGCSGRHSRPSPSLSAGYDWSASPFCVSIREHGARACDEHTLDGRVKVGDPNFVTHVIRSDPDGAEVYWLLGGKIRQIGYAPFTLVIPAATSGNAAYCVGAACRSQTDAFLAGKPRDMEMLFTQTPSGWSGRVR